MNIHEFLAQPHRFEWGGAGGDDCMTFCASWILSQIGIDPAASRRGTYNTQGGAGRIVIRQGGMVAFMAGALEPLGFSRVTAPETGDVGIITAISEIDQTSGEMAAIRYGPLWATLSQGGVRAKKVDFVAAWRAPRELSPSNYAAALRPVANDVPL